MELGEVVSLLDEASQELRFNRQILSTTLENISQGVSVVDAEMRLVAWNGRYQELFGYPDGMLYVGRPVSDLIRWNARPRRDGQRPAVAAGVEEQVRRRLAHLRAGTPHLFERVRASGQVIEMRGQPLPGGGYVTSYSDVTDYKRAEEAQLREINETLEQRVELRTREAEAAQQSKTRFLAAVSHDVLQPLNAARLFASALRESGASGEQSRLAERVDASLRAAEDLLDGLLDISRLEAGALQPESQRFRRRRAAARTRHPVRADGRRTRPAAARARLCSVRCRCTATAACCAARCRTSSPMRLRYTRAGGVLIAARVRDGAVELQVWDTGPGISEHHLDADLRRVPPFRAARWQRRARTRPGALDLPAHRAHAGASARRAFERRPRQHVLDHRAVRPGAVRSCRWPKPGEMPGGDSLAGLRVLCVDNDREILDGMRALLRAGGVAA